MHMSVSVGYALSLVDSTIMKNWWTSCNLGQAHEHEDSRNMMTLNKQCQSRANGLMWCANLLKKKKWSWDGFKAGKCGKFNKGRTLLDCWAGKVTLEGPAVPLTFRNETVKLGNFGQSVMSCSHQIRGSRRRTNRTPFLSCACLRE